MKSRNNIVLIGMPGAGKSTVGVVLAKMLGLEFIDADIVIQKKTKKKLYELLDEHGLDGFREIEDDINYEIPPENAIVATGGSAVYCRRAMEHYKENAYVVYIRISCEELKNRLADLHQRGVAIKPGETLEDLYSERLPLYEQYADITVDSDAGISAIAHKIKNILEKMR